jgi:hypothetical protein
MQELRGMIKDAEKECHALNSHTLSSSQYMQLRNLLDLLEMFILTMPIHLSCYTKNF